MVNPCLAAVAVDDASRQCHLAGWPAVSHLGAGDDGAGGACWPYSLPTGLRRVADSPRGWPPTVIRPRVHLERANLPLGGGDDDGGDVGAAGISFRLHRPLTSAKR